MLWNSMNTLFPPMEKNRLNMHECMKKLLEEYTIKLIIDARQQVYGTV